MNKYDLNPQDEILDIMMEDAAFVKGNFANINKETIRNVLTGKDTEMLRKILVVERSGIQDSNVKSSEIYKGSIQIKVSPDKLICKICLFPDGEIEIITAADIEEALYFSGVRFGIMKQVVRRLEELPIYRRDFIIAKGLPPVEGTTGEIDFHFDKDTVSKPAMDSRGKVNYKELDKVKSVQEGDLLCEWATGKEGVDGMDVFGNILSSKPVKAGVMRAGKNTHLSEDKTQIFADCDGEICYKNGVVSVNKILRLNNVDITTGNIRFIGSIHINGKVCEGYIVKATQNIYVKDVIENSQVSAGNDLVVETGIIGSDEITAEGNLTAGFIENSNIFVKKDITADVILTSQIICEGKVTLSGRKGSLIGGYCKTRELEVSSLGNEAHARTEVEIMTLERLLRQKEEELKKLKEIEREIEQKRKFLDILKKAEDSEKKAMEIQSELFRLVYQKNACKSNSDKMEEELSFLEQTYRSRIKINNKVYPNIRIKISGRQFINQDMMSTCIFKYDGDNIISEV